MNSERGDEPVRVGGPPLGARAVALYLMLTPVFQGVALLLDYQVLRFGVPTWKNALIYFLIAPAVGYLVWGRHPRARFALYIFLTMEAYRAIKTGAPGLLLISLLIGLYLQLPHVRRSYPRIVPGQVRARLRGRLEVLRHLGRGGPGR